MKQADRKIIIELARASAECAAAHLPPGWRTGFDVRSREGMLLLWRPCLACKATVTTTYPLVAADDCRNPAELAGELWQQAGRGHNCPTCGASLPWHRWPYAAEPSSKENSADSTKWGEVKP